MPEHRPAFQPGSPAAIEGRERALQLISAMCDGPDEFSGELGRVVARFSYGGLSDEESGQLLVALILSLSHVSAGAIGRLAESTDMSRDELLDGFTQEMEAWEKAGTG